MSLRCLGRKCPPGPSSNVHEAKDRISKEVSHERVRIAVPQHSGGVPGVEGNPEKTQQSMNKWRAWFKEMTDRGQLKSIGQPLERAGRMVVGKTKTVTDGPFPETKDVIGGYSIVEAKDLDQAAHIASGCPILEVGGSVEVRPVLHLDL